MYVDAMFATISHERLKLLNLRKHVGSFYPYIQHLMFTSPFFLL